MADGPAAADLAEHDGAAPMSEAEHIVYAQAHKEAARAHLDAIGEYLDALWSPDDHKDSGDGSSDRDEDGSEDAGLDRDGGLGRGRDAGGRFTGASPAARGVEAVQSNPVTAATLAAMRRRR